MNNFELEQIVNQQLNSAAFSDYAPNGLQVEGRDEVRKIVTGVTACQALLDEAVRLQADAVMVHHGYFWKNEAPAIKGMKRRRLRTLLANDINLYGWHLPLDAHPQLGNNAQLAQALSINVQGEVQPLVPWGELAESLSGEALAQRIAAVLGREPYTAAIMLHSRSGASPGAVVAARALSTARRPLASTRLLPARSPNRPSTAREKTAFTFLLPVTMPPNAAVFARWGNGWRRIIHWMSPLSILIIQPDFPRLFIRRRAAACR